MSDDLYGRVQDLVASDHVGQQVDRVMPVLQMVLGTRECPTREQVIQDVAICIEALLTPPYSASGFATSGALRVMRGVGEENYEIAVCSATVFGARVALDKRLAEKSRS